MSSVLGVSNSCSSFNNISRFADTPWNIYQSLCDGEAPHTITRQKDERNDSTSSTDSLDCQLVSSTETAHFERSKPQPIPSAQKPSKILGNHINVNINSNDHHTLTASSFSPHQLVRPKPCHLKTFADFSADFPDMEYDILTVNRQSYCPPEGFVGCVGLHLVKLKSIHNFISKWPDANSHTSIAIRDQITFLLFKHKNCFKIVKMEINDKSPFLQKYPKLTSELQHWSQKQ